VLTASDLLLLASAHSAAESRTEVFRSSPAESADQNLSAFWTEEVLTAVGSLLLLASAHSAAESRTEVFRSSRQKVRTKTCPLFWTEEVLTAVGSLLLLLLRIRPRNQGQKFSGPSPGRSADQNLSASCGNRVWHDGQRAPQQKELLSCPPPPRGTVYVSDRVSFRTEGTQRVISVHGVVFAHYSVGTGCGSVRDDHAVGIRVRDANPDRPAFGYSARSLRRYQERFEAEGIRLWCGSRDGLRAAVPAVRKSGTGSNDSAPENERGSNRAIAGKLGCRRR